MKVSVPIFFSILFFSVSSSAQWEFVGNPDGVSENTLVTGLIKHQPNSDVPYIFYKNSLNVAMQKFNGTEWEYVGEQVIDNIATSNHHLAFEFDPINNNSPVIYFHNGQNGPASVAKLNGNTWEPLLGLSNFDFLLNSVFPGQPLTFADYSGFDVGPTGNPVVGFSDVNCLNEGFGNSPGNMSVIVHDSEEWQYLGEPCLSQRTAGTVDLEYSPVTNELYCYHKGGEQQQPGGNQFRVLEKLNGSQWDSIASPFFDLNTVGHMRVNPVTGNVFLFDWGYEDGLGSERQFKVYEWDGFELDSLHENDDLNIAQNDWLVDFHPITGEMYILFSENAQSNIKKYDGSGWVDTPFSDIDEYQQATLDFADFSFNSQGELYILLGINSSARIMKHDGMGEVDNIPKISAESINLKVFPNPASNELNISYKSAQELSVSIVNSLGQSVYHTESIEMDVEVNTSILSPGVYTIILKGQATSITERIVIE